MMRRFTYRHAMLAGVTGVWLTLVSPGIFAREDFDPQQHPEVRTLIKELAQEEGLDPQRLAEIMRGAEFHQSVLDAMSGAAERHLRWGEYRDIFIQPERISEGVDFIAAHADAFARAEQQYGVPAEIIAAIIGVETRYGAHTGRHRVLDSLSTLAFHHPTRGAFFRGELAAFLTITLSQGVDPGALKGSYAGAMGYPQFIPTSYQAYAVDFDGDGLRDLWENPVDAIGSVANYFARHGWVKDAPVVSEAQGPAVPPSGIEFNLARQPYVSVAQLRERGITAMREASLAPDRQVIPLALEVDEGQYRYAMGHDNFYVITRYNHSYLYAMAVTTLAERIRAAMDEQT
ncbi:lytic murein transglycosylase B [Halomonas shantousis]